MSRSSCVKACEVSDRITNGSKSTSSGSGPWSRERA
jgi:hypothetical protein